MMANHSLRHTSPADVAQQCHVADLIEAPSDLPAWVVRDFDSALLARELMTVPYERWLIVLPASMLPLRPLLSVMGRRAHRSFERGVFRDVLLENGCDVEG